MIFRKLMLLTMLGGSLMAKDYEKILWPVEPKPLSFHQAYIFTKELLYSLCVLTWRLDYHKATSAIVYCDQCNFCMDSLGLYGYLVGMEDTYRIACLKDAWYSQDLSYIKNFMLDVYNQAQIYCPQCAMFCGWHLGDKDMHDM